ncbi:dehydrogenase [Steroidobacter agaridevorans]|uniref:Dehydrogenase n=1 Tax=Steroidobacter agaridevorans TaxID=2695856 RepID=A0A829YJP7_9GAMM|nr:c-type cytochrome [Steroidobacter agaridevorans]GFE83429.1 dehydrogenase [Steroidobacter agaridevorans]
MQPRPGIWAGITGAALWAAVTAAALIVLFMAIVQTAGAKPLTSVANRPWPAPVTKDEPEVSPPLPPEEAIKTFHMAPGYRLELVAAEPLTRDPILLEFDSDGRAWVVELHAFSINERMDNSFEPINEVVILEDSNDDRVFDKRTVFMDKLIMPRAMKVLDNNCALIGEPPNLWKACDTNGDLRADTKELIDAHFSTQGVVEHGANGLYWGMDNTLVVSEHTYNLELEDGKLRIVPTLSRGQWGVTQDNGGRIYRNVNTDPLFVDYVAARYYVRNPNAVRTRGLYESLVKQEDTLIWPVHPTRGVNRGYRAEIFREDGSSTYYGGVSSPLIYRGNRLPEEIRNQPFVVDGPTNIVHLLKLKNDNGELSASDYYPKGEFLASTDVRFRPVQVVGGWDGAMYVVDMYRGISQDGPIQTDYLRSYNARRGLAKGINYGRIYRVVHEGMSFDDEPRMSKETSAQLVKHLTHANGWWRDTTQQLLIQRGDKSIAPALTTMAAESPAPYTRLQALWTLDGLGVLEAASVSKALDDRSPDVRAAAIRLSERWLSNPSIRTAVLEKIDDGNGFVRRQLTATLGELPRNERLKPIIAMLRKYGSDPILVDIAVSGLHGQENEALTELTRQAPFNLDAISVLAGATGHSGDLAGIQATLAMATDARQPEPLRIALLNGVALGLQGGAASDVGRAVAGGRAGSGIPGMGRRRTVTAGLQLPTEPAALIKLASASGALADAAKSLVALVTWPGKPAPRLASRTPAEEKLFVAGKQVYANTCVGCHLAQGEGSPPVGAKLVGSPYANADGDAIIRILINGKEGRLGVMPPLGAAMSDEEVASVLTFIRQSWSNTGTPVSPSAVKETRAAYAHRTTPWSDDELVRRKR